MERITESKAVSNLLKYTELKEKMHNDVNNLFLKLEKINRDKTDLMKQIIDTDEMHVVIDSLVINEIIAEPNDIILDFTKEHYEEYDVLRGYNYDKTCHLFVMVTEIEQKHTGVGLHSIVITFGRTPEEFTIEHKIYV